MSTPASVNGRLVLPDGTAPPVGSFVQLDLKNIGTAQPTVDGVAIYNQKQYPLSTVDGTWSGTLYRNDNISCNGVFNSVWAMTYYSGGRQVYPAKFVGVSQASADLDVLPALNLGANPLAVLQPTVGAESALAQFPVAASTWTCVHNFGTQAVVAQFYDLNWQQLIPDTAISTNLNTFTATFVTPQAGFMVVMNVGNWTPSVANPNNIIGNPTSSQSIGNQPLALQGVTTHTNDVIFSKTPFIDARAYGAVGDGVTDNTTAFTNLFTAVGNAVTANIGTVSVFIPPGNYLVTGSGGFLGSLNNHSASGLKIFGAGRSVTRITFQPPNSGSVRNYLFQNNNSWQFISFEDLSFFGDTTQISGQPGYTKTSFMLSNSTGTAQNYFFSRVHWDSWDRVIDLTGSNTNSEMTWDHCGFYHYCLHGLYVDLSVGTGAEQFLNYNFRDCQFEVNDGALVDMAYGGSINIWGGSWIHTNTTQAPTLPFLNLGQGTSNTGQTGPRVYVAGVRVEHRAQGSMLVNSQWNFGSITFDTIDDSSQSFQSGSQNWKTASFTPQNDQGATVVFRNCQLMGKHEYVFLGNSFNRAHDVVYEDSTFWNHTSPADFIIRTGSTNPGGQQLINFVRSYFPNAPAGSPQVGQPQLYSSEYGFDTVMGATSVEHVLAMRGPNANLPGNLTSNTLEVPLNVLITKIVFYAPSGAVTDVNPAKYTVQTSEGTPTVLATLDTTNTTGAASNGFNETYSIKFKAASDNQRMLVIQNNQAGSQFNGGGFVLVFYIGG